MVFTSATGINLLPSVVFVQLKLLIQIGGDGMVVLVCDDTALFISHFSYSTQPWSFENPATDKKNFNSHIHLTHGHILFVFVPGYEEPLSRRAVKQ